jgi:hypothetical protein
MNRLEHSMFAHPLSTPRIGGNSGNSPVPQGFVLVTQVVTDRVLLPPLLPPEVPVPQRCYHCYHLWRHKRGGSRSGACCALFRRPLERSRGRNPQVARLWRPGMPSPPDGAPPPCWRALDRRGRIPARAAGNNPLTRTAA